MGGMARPPLPHETALAEALFPGPDWASGTVQEGGQSHLVLVARGEAVLRMARTPEAAATVLDAVRAFADAAEGWGPTAPPGAAGLVHGDLAGHNMHWDGAAWPGSWTGTWPRRGTRR